MGQTSSMKKFLIFHKTFCFPKQGSVFLLVLESFSSLFCFLKPFCIYSRYSTSQWIFFSELGFTDDCHTYLNISTLAYLLEFHLNEYTAIKTEFLSYSQLFSTLISKFSLNYPFFYYHLGHSHPSYSWTMTMARQPTFKYFYQSLTEVLNWNELLNTH